jgi:hypothetical protein
MHVEGSEKKPEQQTVQGKRDGKRQPYDTALGWTDLRVELEGQRDGLGKRLRSKPRDPR